MLRKFIVCSVVIILCSCALPSARAEEPIDAFLSELQARRLFDVALRHVERMAKSSLAPQEFKDEADYRLGSLLVNYARSTRGADQKRQRLDQAQKAFEKFLSEHANHPSASLARSQLGNILVERARQLMAKANSDPTNRQALLKQGSRLYAQAYKSLTKSREELKPQLRAAAARRGDSGSPGRLKELQAKYVQTYLAIARVLFEQAKTVREDPKQYRAKLTQAAQEFGEIVDKYRAYSASILALRYQGECYQLMGEHKQALSYFKELLQNQDASAAVRRIKTQALSMSIECWLETDPNRGPDKSIASGSSWLDKLRDSEKRDAAVQELRLAVARAYIGKAKLTDNDKQAQKARKAARELASEVARYGGPSQAEAQRFLVAMGGSTKTREAALVDGATAAASFDEARIAATKSLDELKRAKMTVKILGGQLKDIRDPGRRAQIEERKAATESETEALTKRTLELYEQADRMATQEDIDAWNGVRYYLAFLNYSLGNYRRAAVLGSFVAMHHPDSVAAKECANVALAARQRLYQVSSETDKELQGQAISKLSELMVANWPGQKTAESAMMTQLDLIVSRGDMAKAESFLKKFPVDSPQRAKAELRIGQAIWREYLRQLSVRSKAGSDSSSDGSLVRLKTRAQEVLASGIDRVGSVAPDESTVRAALTLAQIYVDSGEPQKALELMRRDGFGALKLVESKSPWTQKIPPLTTETYKTAIRAHVANAAGSGDTASAIDSAQEMLDALRAEFRNQPDGKKKLIPIYISLAKDLERQLTTAAPADRRALSRGFESFLRSAAEGNKDVAIQNWVGATFFSLGQGMLSGNKSSPEAQRYFTESSKAYDQVLMMAKSQPGALSPTALMQVQARQAMAMRQLGKYAQAMDLFEKLLNGRKSYLNIQIEAAKTLQQWGASGGNVQALDKAIAGDKPGKDGKNTIWGWGRIAKIVAKNEKYRDMFHEARYNIAACRYRSGLKKSGAKKNETLKRAKSDITLTKRLFNLGNKQQAQRYESLLKQIQGALGEQQVGFAKS